MNAFLLLIAGKEGAVPWICWRGSPRQDSSRRRCGGWHDQGQYEHYLRLFDVIPVFGQTCRHQAVRRCSDGDHRGLTRSLPRLYNGLRAFQLRSKEQKVEDAL